MANIVISDKLAQYLQEYAEMNSVSIETVIARCLDVEVRGQPLEISDALCCNLIASSPSATFISRLDNNAESQFIYCNSATISLLGAKGEKALVGKRLLDFISPQENEKLSQRTQQYKSDKSLLTTEYHIRCLDGTIKYVRVSSIKIDYYGSPALMSVMTDITEQHITETALRQDRNLLRTLLDNLPYEVYVKDRESRFVMANRATLKIWKKDTLDELVGKTDFDSGPDSDPVMSQFYYDQEQRIFETGQPVINHEVEPSGTDERYLSINKYPLFDAKGDITQIVCINFDVTRFKVTEHALREKEETTRAFQRYLQNLHEITLELSQAETLDHLYRRVIELGREKLGFDRLGLWIIDREQGLTHGTYGTDEEGNLRKEYDIERPIVDGMSEFEIIHNKERITISEDVTLRDNDNRPIGKGWHAFAILWNGKEGIGWLSADNYLSHAPLRLYEFDLLSAYGTAIGHLITQKKVGDALQASEETARAFQEYLRALHHITLELSQIENVDDFYRRVVELGREKLGFDRLGLWLFMPDRKSVYGTFGTDEVGSLRDEREMIHSIEDEFVGLRMLRNKEHVVFVNGNVIRDDQYNIVGNGWSGLALLWNGSEGIGWLATDNLLSQSPPRPYEEDFLSTYSNVVGHLLSRKRAEETLRHQNEYFSALYETTLAIMNRLNTTELLNTILNRAIALVGTAYGSIFLFSPDKTALTAAIYTGYPKDLPLRHAEIGKGLSGTVWQTGKIVVINDYQNWDKRSFGAIPDTICANLGIPLKSKDELIGILCVDYHEKGRIFTEDDIAILTRFAALASIALVNAQLYNSVQQELEERKQIELRLQRYNKRLSILREIDHQILFATSPQSIANVVLKYLAELIPCEFLSVILHDRELTEERIFALRHTPDLGGIYTQEIQPVVQNDVLETLKSGKTAIAPDLRQQSGPHAHLAEELESHGVRSALASPMIVQDRLIGTIALAAREVGFFTAEHQKITEEVSAQVAIALHQAELKDQLAQYHAELEQRVRERTTQLEHANRELELFSYSVSHDLRAPLRAIQGFAEIIARRHRATLNEESVRYFDNIVLASEQMNQLITDLLAYTRLGRGGTPHLRAISLDLVFAEVITNLTPQLVEAQAQLHLAEAFPIVMGDNTLLKQIFTNLLENAIIYRRVGIPPVIDISYAIEATYAIIRVTDNGIGIPAEFHEKIFHIFQRLHSQDQYPGTGIGLAIVRKSVEMLSGSVWVDLREEQGSVFCVKLKCGAVKD